MANEKTQQILDLVKGLTILELADLVKALETEFGVSAAPVAVAAAPGAVAAVVEEKTEFDVELTSFEEDKKLKVIKEVKDIAGLSLGEAKELVVTCPKMVKTAVSKDEAEKIKDQLEAVGAKVTIK